MITIKNNNTMIKALVSNFVNVVENAFNNNNAETIKAMVEAYNVYQENERNCVDYIYNINDVNDVCDVLKGGMNMHILVALYNTRVPFFLLDIDGKPTALGKVRLKKQLQAYAEEIIENMLMYPHSYPQATYCVLITDIFQKIV